MAPNKFSIIAVVSDDNGQEISRDLIHESSLNIPHEVEDLGLSHAQQHQLIDSTQSFFLAHQTKGLAVFNGGICPECGRHLNKNGYQKSLLHGIYTDNYVSLSKFSCSSHSCSWNYNPSVKSHFGDNISPELAKTQAELGATLSFRKAKKSLNLMSGKDRPINNHMRIRRTVFSVGAKIENYSAALASKKCSNDEACNNMTPTSDEECRESPKSYSKEMIIGVDGAYIHDASNPGHNFEAMVAKVYNPDNITRVSNNRYAITKKQCIGSSMKDAQKTMKEKTLTAARLEGIDKNTKLTGLADGAKNCWNVIQSLKPYCALLVCILDWFHIAKYFTAIGNKLPGFSKPFLDSAHVALWYGNVEAALESLETLMRGFDPESKHIEALEKMIIYISSNSDYIVNYDERSKGGLPFSSQMAESTVEHFVAERFKKKQKMAWKRLNSHYVLQVRGAIISNTYDQYWSDAYNKTMHAAA